jgi:hypothetical protein
MLNDDEAPPNGETISFENPQLTSYQESFDIFRISLAVYELFAENQFDRYRDAP